MGLNIGLRIRNWLEERMCIYICLIKTKKMLFYLFIYSNNILLHISNTVTIHHQETVTVYAAYSIYLTSALTSC
jgi:hypothetical protein